MDDLVRTETLWRTTRDILRHDSRITPQMLGFLELAEAQGIINETLYLEVPNDLARSMLDQRIRGYIEEALALNLEDGTNYQFRVTTNPDIEPSFVEAAAPEVISEARNTDRQNYTPVVNGFETRLNPKYTFETFVLGESNSFARAAAWAVANAPAQGYNPLFIHGNSGLGKTHLLHAIGNEALNLYPTYKVH